MTSKLKEGVMQGVFTLCACVSILAVALICIFLFANGVPTLFKIGPLKFLLGTTWKPGNDIFGILPMILGSIYVTAGGILLGGPLGGQDRLQAAGLHCGHGGGDSHRRAHRPADGHLHVQVRVAPHQ